eukprot:CAMPEP_0114496698 /NCGR_PEP_ID=MMETSP0109-20121206/5912_1 /TAXON_ID=29199 /ORGANISM="Chlorarachnion reptans, Strain CCCM449" /LENGTH=179 /DNA_ID=CAMNT_0001673995 /DNA_START=117 /DNA_END=656 /DNA_ORIENTATION=+
MPSGCAFVIVAVRRYSPSCPPGTTPPTDDRRPPTIGNRTGTQKLPIAQTARLSINRHLPDEDKKENIIMRFLGKIGVRKLWKKYGLYGVGTLLSLDAITLVGVYMYIDNLPCDVVGLVKAYDFFNLKELLGITRPELTEKTTTLVTTVAIYKLLGPVRIGAALVLTPFVARYFRGPPSA